ncbi:expressed unknown protein [Seminavis robusta]|uniref:Uncharacterized protein n=1 Tax=Seminavis robusta TaxID=568900 RepID=A0A9N8HDP6_9STRA|nr:expressed unknown protein [Seminavis robusta]|eukprot:Sro267_g103510.1 n/a (533) ;mRNA; f:64200-65798
MPTTRSKHEQRKCPPLSKEDDDPTEAAVSSPSKAEAGPTTCSKNASASPTRRISPRKRKLRTFDDYVVGYGGGRAKQRETVDCQKQTSNSENSPTKTTVTPPKSEGKLVGARAKTPTQVTPKTTPSPKKTPTKAKATPKGRAVKEAKKDTPDTCSIADPPNTTTANDAASEESTDKIAEKQDTDTDSSTPATSISEQRPDSPSTSADTPKRSNASGSTATTDQGPKDQQPHEHSKQHNMPTTPMQRAQFGRPRRYQHYPTYSPVRQDDGTVLRAPPSRMAWRKPPPIPPPWSVYQHHHFAAAGRPGMYPSDAWHHDSHHYRSRTPPLLSSPVPSSSSRQCQDLPPSHALPSVTPTLPPRSWNPGYQHHPRQHQHHHWGGGEGYSMPFHPANSMPHHPSNWTPVRPAQHHHTGSEHPPEPPAEDRHSPSSSSYSYERARQQLDKILNDAAAADHGDLAAAMDALMAVLYSGTPPQQQHKVEEDLCHVLFHSFVPTYPAAFRETLIQQAKAFLQREGYRVTPREDSHGGRGVDS